MLIRHAYVVVRKESICFWVYLNIVPIELWSYHSVNRFFLNVFDTHCMWEAKVHPNSLDLTKLELPTHHNKRNSKVFFEMESSQGVMLQFSKE